MKPTKIAVCVYTTNAAQTIRTVEIAKAIIQHRQREHTIKNASATSCAEQKTSLSTGDLVLRFFTYRGCPPGGGPKRTIDYEHLIHDAGFDVEYFGSSDQPQGLDNDETNHSSAIILDDDMWLAFLQSERNHEGIFPPPYEERAAPYLRAIKNTLRNFQPELILYGLFPEVAVASIILGLKTVSFASFPRNVFTDWMHKCHDFEDNKLATNDISKNEGKNPWKVIKEAAVECGLQLLTDSSNAPTTSSNTNAEFLQAIRPNHTIVCDFECYYQNQNIPSDVTIVGPMISSYDALKKSKDVKEIESFLLQPSSSSASIDGGEVCTPIKVLLTMGSTGEFTAFLEGLKALCFSKQGTFCSVVMIPATVLHQFSEDDNILKTVISRDDILTVTKFVPTRSIMELVDVVLCHGGQQTIQCSLAAGVPIVGRPFHKEQLYNLENVERSEAGVCILPFDWKEENIRSTLVKVGGNMSAYKQAAVRMQIELLKNSSGLERAGAIIGDMISS